MEKRLFLIDGHALVFKMYYAFLRHPMINSKGADMSILFGFTKYLLELIEKEKPTHLAVAFDPPGGTFRNEIYHAYKANRDATPQLVIDSLEPLCDLCKAMRIPVLMVKGFEADDVIGSMAKRAEKEGFTVYMVTPDKDYGQLISPSIIQYKPGKSGSEHELIDVNKVCEKYNISKPEQVIEILTIMGDSSDNVPGVKGVGEVGAGKLISKYGSVSNVYEHINELTPKQKEAFENAKGHIELSHTLVTIMTDIPLDVTSEEMDLSTGFGSEAADLFEEYEFGSLKRFLGDVKPSTPKEEKKIKLNECSPEELVAKASKTGSCAVIIEDDQATLAVKEDGELNCCSARGSINDFKELFLNTEVVKFGYDLKQIKNHLVQKGFDLCGRFMDISLMHYLIDPEKSHKIEILSRIYIGINLEEVHQTDKQPETLSLFDEPAEEEQTNRTTEAAATILLGKKLEEELRDKGLDTLYDTMEEPLLKVLSRMELQGVKLDLAQLRRYASALAVEMDEIQNRVREMAGEPDLNIMSPKQIGVVLFEKLKLDPKIKPKSGVRYSYPTDEDTLSALADKHPIITEILEYRGIKKLLSIGLLNMRRGFFPDLFHYL